MTNTTALDLDRVMRALIEDVAANPNSPGYIDLCMFTLNRYTADLRAALAAKGQQEPVARVPTEEMLKAARDWSVKKYGQGIGNDAAVGCWQAMFDAAPVAQQSEAGAPTAAALPVIGGQRWSKEAEMMESWLAKPEEATFKEALQDKSCEIKIAFMLEQAAQICDRLKWMMDAGGGEYRTGERLSQAARMIRELSGRESAAPAAPVREGDCEQDAKRIDNLRTALQQISETRFGYDGDCGTARIADDALYADEQAAAMQKGASND